MDGRAAKSVSSVIIPPGHGRIGADSEPSAQAADTRAALSLYETSIRHSRRDPIRHDVRASSYWWLVDVDTVQVNARGVAPLPGLPTWTARLTAIRPADLDLGVQPAFGSAVRFRALALAASEPGPAPDVSGPAHLACTGRVAGYGFDPLSVVWLRDRAGAVSAVLAIVRNTHGGIHHYLLRPDAHGRAEVDKSFYVSPFNDVGGRYLLDVAEPGESLYVSVLLRRRGEPDFVASVSGSRRRADLRALLGLSVRRPAEPLAVAAKIRAHGIYLWARRLRVHPVPETDTGRADTRRKVSAVPAAPGGPVTAAFALGAKLLLAAASRRMPVRIEYPDGRIHGAGRNSPSAPRMIIHRPRDFHARLGRSASIGLGESYMAGDWSSPDAPALLAEFAARQATLVPRPLRMQRGLYIPRPPRSASGSVDNTRDNISAHYDLSNEFFSLFLDETMTYSSALFPSLPFRRGRLGDTECAPSYAGGMPGYADLAPAQEAKIDALLDAAHVGPGTRVLEIGTGWGELCLRAARRGATVRSVTLSSEQRDLAQRRADEAGFGSQVAVELLDYREVRGEYDAVISVEMIEAVGLDYLGEYFATIDSVLAPRGRVALQAILMDDERVRTTRNNYTWMHKYVFPGGRIPSVESIESALATTQLRLGKRVHFGLHYAETLRLWEDRFTSRAADVRQLGFDDSFIRMWRFYLHYCEAGFRSGYLDVAQLDIGRTT